MKDYTDNFEVRIRANGDHFSCLKDAGVPDVLRNLIREIHLNEFYDAFPCDWIYQQIYFAFERLKECDCEALYWGAVNEIQADIYSNDLFEWAKKDYASNYIQEALEEMEEVPTINQVIELAQQRAIEVIYQQVWDFIQKNEANQ